MQKKKQMMKILITGGGGFLGSEILRMLIDRGDECQFAARGDYPEIRALGATQIRGDLADPAIANKAVAGCDAVIHVAAKAGIWGGHADYYSANVIATQNIVDACIQHNVNYLIHTSTPSVTFNGKNVENGKQNMPHADSFLTSYAETKSKAEQIALNAKGIKVIALRPHLIYGAGDPNLLPRMVNSHRGGKIKIIGDGNNKVDITHVKNAAIAHLQALDSLVSGVVEPVGKAYFISDDAPVKLWNFLDRSVTALGYEKISGQVSHKTAFRAAGVLETFHKIFRPNVEPRITRFVADQMSTSHWYDMEPAKRDFGYQPVIDQNAAFEDMIEDLKKRGFAA